LLFYHLSYPTTLECLIEGPVCPKLNTLFVVLLLWLQTQSYWKYQRDSLLSVDGKSQQLTPEPDTTPLPDIGTLLYYACAVDPILLVASSTLATQQTKGTHQMMKDITQLLNYCATHPSAIIWYRKIGFNFASYLSENGAQLRTAGYY
jgi:hypothetical protein